MSESSDASCRIVILSSSLGRGVDFVKDLQTLHGSTKPRPKSSTNTGTAIWPASDLREPVIHTWAISNRYYSAKVHFSVHSIPQIYPAVFDGVPAVILVWSKGEPFEQTLKEIKRVMDDHEPEVLLAVRIPDDVHTKVKDTEKTELEDDNNIIDSTLLSHGFEYIDASRPAPPTPTRDQAERELDTNDDIPHLPRVLDALSTIMWPSMTSNDADTLSSPTSNPRSGLHSQSTIDQIVNRDPLALILALEELDSEFGFDGDAPEDPDAFDQFHSLASADSDSNWDVTSNRSDIEENHLVTSSPTALDFNDVHQPFEISSKASERKTNPKISIGFEDDFTVFVSAPPGTDTSDSDAEQSQTDSGRTTPEYASLMSADQSTFLHAGPLYHSLGSMSDLGDAEESK